MQPEAETSSRRDVHLPPVDPSKRGVLETRSGRPRSAPFAELQVTRADDAMDFLPELAGAGRSLIAGSSEDRASTPSGKVRASAFGATSPSVAAAVPDDAGSRRREKSGAAMVLGSGSDSAGAALTVGLFANTSSDAQRVDTAGPAARSTGDSAGGSGIASTSGPKSAAATTTATRFDLLSRAPCIPSHAASRSSSSSSFTSTAGGVGKQSSSSKAGGEGFLLTTGVPVREGNPSSSGAGDSDDDAPPPLATASSAEIAAKAEAAKKAAAFKAANAPAVLPMDPSTVPRPNVPRSAPTEPAGKASLDPKPPEIANDVIKRRGDDTEKNKKPVSDKSSRTDSEFELHFRHSLLNFEVKSSRTITSKPHGGSSLGAGNSDLKCDDDVAHPDEHVSEVSIRGQEKEARNRWKEDAGTRSGVFLIRDSGSSSILEPGSRNLQPMMAGGKEYGFETSVSHMIHRTQGVQLSDKGDDGKNVFQPTSGWAAEEAKRPRKLGGEGSRAPARATVGGAAAVKLARQEGVEVDRKKEVDAEAKTVGFERSATRDDVRLTLSLETLEEVRDAGSVTRVNSNSHVSKDQAAEILDKRPSQLDAKTGEKSAPYALQTSVCNDGSRDHGVLTSASMAESGLKRKGFRVFLSDRSKGTGEDKMRAPFY